jgi:hypothetical protein
MKRFPRTLNEAFPNTMENGASIQKFYHQTTALDVAMRVVGIIAMVVVLLDLFIWRP